MVSRIGLLFCQLNDDPFDVQIRCDHGRAGEPDGYTSKRMSARRHSSQGNAVMKRDIVYADDFAAVSVAYGVKKPFYAGS